MSRDQKLRKIALLREKKKREARKDLLAFTNYTFPKFQASDFHIKYYRLLNKFAHGDIKKLIITVPPQHGKSEGSTRRLPSFIFGLDPDRKVAIASYSTPFARKFNRDIQRIIDCKEYHELFPDSCLNAKRTVTDGNYLKNADEFEIINYTGALKAVGRGGALTGLPVDTLIIDDLYKNAEEGNSQTILESAWDWYTSTADTRLHNDSQQLIVFTRWNEGDLVGRLEEKETVITLTEELEEYNPDIWYKINFEAIKESSPTKLDPREKNEPLWKERHSLKKLQRSRELDPNNFNSLYQGDPKPKEGLMYERFLTYINIPENNYGTYNYTDTADNGDDFLCSINYVLSNTGQAYITDLIYTEKPMEVTEPMTADLLDRGNVSLAKIESNNGGRGFARKVQDLKKGRTTVHWFHQSKNKESRIFTASAGVQRDILFPEGWEYRWPEFCKALTHFKKKFKANKHDDAPDTITGIYEEITQYLGMQEDMSFTIG